MPRTPAQEAERLAGELRALAARLRDADNGEVVFTRSDVDKIVETRLAREQKRTRRAEREIEDLEAEIARLRGRQRREDRH